jgi:cell division protein ZapA (FtsZ GTPase activity inhibitor)
MASRVVHVDIHGQRYAVRSELDAQYIAELAAYLDEKMRMAARELSSADSLRISVIAALNVVDELFRARADASGLEGQVLARTAEIERLVDAVLDDARISAVNE